MIRKSPKIVLLAGPNGAGKTTVAPELLQGALQVREFVNADVIAQGLSAFSPEEVSISAGRVMLERIHTLAANKVDFAFETTLASKSFVKMIVDLKQDSDYRAFLIFICLDSPALAVKRVKSRVIMGGHYVSDEVIRRRYNSGLTNFLQLYMPIMDQWYFYDNSRKDQLRIIAAGSGSQVQEVKVPAVWNSFRERYSG